MFEQFINILNTIFSPLTMLYPPLALAFLAIIATALTYALNRLLVRRQLVEEIKTKMTEIRKNLTLAQQAKNLEAAEKWMREFVSVSNKYVKLTVKSMVVAVIIAVFVLPWVSVRYSGNVVKLPFELPFFGNALNGVYWYVFVSIVVGWLINKILGG